MKAPQCDVRLTPPVEINKRISLKYTQKLMETRWGNVAQNMALYEGWNFNSGNYLFTTDTK